MVRVLTRSSEVKDSAAVFLSFKRGANIYIYICTEIISGRSDYQQSNGSRLRRDCGFHGNILRDGLWFMKASSTMICAAVVILHNIYLLQQDLQ